MRTQQDADRVVALRASGMSVRGIAKATNMSRYTVNRILSGEWRPPKPKEPETSLKGVHGNNARCGFEVELIGAALEMYESIRLPTIRPGMRPERIDEIHREYVSKFEQCMAAIKGRHGIGNDPDQTGSKL